jgi:hypothetical protein
MSTYLYVKTHNRTGLKYLGKTIQNPYKYKGSGVYWCRHLLKHGNDVTTEILKECQTNDEIKYWGQYYSNLWNVVDDNAWANLKPETGEGGSGKMSTSTKEKIKHYQESKVWTEKAVQSRLTNCLKNAALRKGQSWTDKKRQSTLTTYLEKNLELALQIIRLYDTGLNNLQISKKLNITWDKVKYSLLHRADFESYQRLIH